MGDAIAGGEQQVASAIARHMEAEKSLVAATHQRDQVRAELRRIEEQLATERGEIARLHAEAEAARSAQRSAARTFSEAVQSREAAEAEARKLPEQARPVAAGFPGIAGAGGSAARRIGDDVRAACERGVSRAAACREESTAGGRAHDFLAAAARGDGAGENRAGELLRTVGMQVKNCARKRAPGRARRRRWKWNGKERGSRAAQLDETCAASASRSMNCAPSAASGQIEKARNDADRDYLRQTCVAELNAQPEELMAQEATLLVGEELDRGGNELQRNEGAGGSDGPGEHDGAR